MDINGQPIERAKKDVHHAVQAENTALLTGNRRDGRAMLSSPNRRAHVAQGTGKASYVLRDDNNFQRNALTMYVTLLDTLVEERLMWHLRPFFATVLSTTQTASTIVPTTFMREQFEAVPETTKLSTRETTRAELQHTIAQLEREYTLTFDLMTDEEVRKNREARMRLVRRVEALDTAEQAEAEAEQDAQEAATLLRSGTMREQWKKWKVEKKRTFLRIVTQEIMLEEVADNWLQLRIVWHKVMTPEQQVNVIDTAYILRRNACLTPWSEEEKEIMRAEYPTGKRLELQNLLPRRSWESIRQQAYRQKLLRQTRDFGVAMREDITMNDVRFMESHNLEWNESRLWWSTVTQRVEEA